MMSDADLARTILRDLPMSQGLIPDPGPDHVTVSDFRASSDKERDARPMNWAICCDTVNDTVIVHNINEAGVVMIATKRVLHARVTLLEGKFTDSDFHGWRNAKGPKRINAQIMMVNVSSLLWDNVGEIPHAQVLTNELHQMWRNILKSAHQGDTDKIDFYYNQLLQESERTRPAGFQTRPAGFQTPSPSTISRASTCVPSSASEGNVAS